MSGFGYVDMSDAIVLTATNSYTVTRRTAAAPVGGIRVAPTTTTLTILASAQPASGQVIQRLPEGKRDRETMVLYTKTQLLVLDATHEPDLVAVDGGTFEVDSCKRWAAAGNFYEAVITRAPGT